MTFQKAWQSSPLPAVIVPDVVGSRLAAEVRERGSAAGYVRYGLLDRGSYAFAREVREPELLAALTGIASEITGRALVVKDARLVRLVAGDYVLVRHDRVHDDRPVELLLDLSAVPVPGADVHYRHRGQVYFVAPSAPGSLSIVERGPTVMKNDRYVSRRNEGAEVIRLEVLLGEEA